MIIREYAPKDKAEVITLLVQLQEHLVSVDDEKVQTLTERYRIEYLDYLLDELRKNNGVLLVAENATTVIGLIAGIVEPKDQEDVLTNRCPIRGKVLELIVSKDYRSDGAGTALLQAMEDYFAAAYESAQTADKMGWSGGQVDSEATRMKFLQAQQSANMFNKFELQEYGLESQLSVARMYAEAEMESLALQFYQDEVNLALQKADRTGYYISPEAGEMMKQIQAADKLANSPNATPEQKKRAETIKGAAYAYFDSLGFEKDEQGKYIGVETLAQQEFEETQYMNKVQEQYQKDMLNEAKKQTSAAQTSANAAVRNANANINTQEMNDYYQGLEKYGQLEYNGKVYPSMVMNSNGKYEGITGGNMTTVNGTPYLTTNGKTYVWAPNSDATGKVPGKWAETSVKVGSGENINRTFPKQSTGTSTDTGDGDGEEGK